MSRVFSTAMSVGEVATRLPICVDRDMTILGASDLMRCYDVDELVVTDRPGGMLVPIGIISARDIITRIIATRLDPAVLTAGDIAWSWPSGAKSTDSVFETLKLLRSTKNNVLAVTNLQGGLSGMVHLDDLLRALAEK
jgi:CBS domain-containing protein